MPQLSWDAGMPLGDMISRLALALVLGGILGFERELADKPAGLRTYMLVTLGSAVFVLIGLAGPNLLGASTQDPWRLDPLRTLQGIVTGIGFLGAGSIMQGRTHITGLTTAAGIWLSGSIGAACGFGAYGIAIAASVTGFLTLRSVGYIEWRMRKGRRPGEGTSQPTDKS